MRNSRLQSFSLSSLRTSFLARSRSSSASSRRVSNAHHDGDSFISDSTATSPLDTISAIMFQQPAMVDMQEERRSFGSELQILEPRPIVYWGGLEERMHL